MFGVSFLQAGGSQFLLIVESARHGWAGPVPCEGFLVGGTYVCVLVNEAGTCLSEGQCCVQ